MHVKALIKTQPSYWQRPLRTLGATALSCLLGAVCAVAPAEAQTRGDLQSTGLAYPATQQTTTQQSDVRYAEVGSLRLEVEDANTGRRVMAVSPCEGVELLRGDRVRLRLVAVDGPGEIDSWADGQLLKARFFYLDQEGVVELGRQNRDDNEILVMAKGTESVGPNGVTTLLGYELPANLDLAEGVKAKGSITVTVREPGAPTSSASAVATTPAQVTSPQEIIARLYRGILLREPDTRGATPRIETVERNGYRAVLAAAQDIAASPESLQTTARKSNPQTRLEALYEQLLGISRSRVEAETWGRQYSLISQGKIKDVVEEIVRSAEFRQVHGYAPMPSVYYQNN